MVPLARLTSEAVANAQLPWGDGGAAHDLFLWAPDAALSAGASSRRPWSPAQSFPRGVLDGVPRRRLKRRAGRAGDGVLHPGDVERRAPSPVVVALDRPLRASGRKGAHATS